MAFSPTLPVTACGVRTLLVIASITHFALLISPHQSLGFGIYFAANASYSNSGYALDLPLTGEKQMFLCEVALGMGPTFSVFVDSSGK
jgi:hypothetical protein